MLLIDERFERRQMKPAVRHDQEAAAAIRQLDRFDEQPVQLPRRVEVSLVPSQRCVEPIDCKRPAKP